MGDLKGEAKAGMQMAVNSLSRKPSASTACLCTATSLQAGGGWRQAMQLLVELQCQA